MFYEQEKQLQADVYDAKKKKKIRNFAAILKKLSVSIFETGFSFVSALHIENCKLVIADCGMIE